MKKILITIFAISAILTGCSSESTLATEEVPASEEAIIEDNLDQPLEVLSLDDMANLKIDESGEVMVLMYHNIGEEEATWTRTPENFRRDLETLYNSGFRAISLEDYANGNISTEAGFTPVVFTFDDGNENNFRYIKHGEENIIDPKCAVGIMEDFKKEYPDFNMTATFFLNGLAFGDSSTEKEKLTFLIENNYSIGNHTMGHPNLRDLSSENIQKEIATLKERYENMLPNLDINTLALPFGGKPSADDYTLTYKGEYDGVIYENIAVLLVGWDPYFSPYHKEFDFSNIRRVRASEMNVDGVGLYDWLYSYEKGSKRRYISDGNPDIIAVPSSRIDLIDQSRFTDKEIISYENN